MISTANPVLRHRALLLGTSAALALVLVKPAAAQCVVEPDNIITCSGDNDDQQTLNNGGSLTVTTEPGFSIDSPDNGLVISGTGSLIYNDSNASTIIGRGYDGIAVGNGGGGRRGSKSGPLATLPAGAAPGSSPTIWEPAGCSLRRPAPSRAP